MGLLSKLGLRLPGLTAPLTLHRVTVQVEGHDPHVFIYATGERFDEATIVYNEHAFVLPERYSFVKIEDNATEIGSLTVPLTEIQPVDGDATDAERERVSIPEKWRGQEIPAVDRRGHLRDII